MEAIKLRAHYDGKQICLDEPFALAPNTRLVVTVLPAESEEDREEWLPLSGHGLTAAYGEDEPEYPPEMIKERIEEYESG
jgi:hypothetical protein